MATYKGDTGIDNLMRDLRARSEQLVTNTTVAIMRELVDRSPVSIEGGNYAGKVYQNDRGSFINNWEATAGVSTPPRIERGADPEANESLNSAQFISYSYKLGDNVVIANTSDYMAQVESEGWTLDNTEDRPDNWEDASAYGPVRQTTNIVVSLMREAVKSAKASSGEVPF